MIKGLRLKKFELEESDKVYVLVGNNNKGEQTTYDGFIPVWGDPEASGWDEW